MSLFVCSFACVCVFDSVSVSFMCVCLCFVFVGACLFDVFVLFCFGSVCVVV